MSYDSKRPKWLQDHPKDFIYKMHFGAVWYRPIEAGFEIDHLEIPAEIRGRGLGQKLLHGFIEFCRDQKKDQSFEVWLEVSSKNLVAKKLYLKLGFKQVHLRPCYYEDLSDALVMTLKA